MKYFAKFVGMLAVLFLVTGQADAADKKAEVTAMMEKAISHFNEVGADQAYKDFSDPNGGFIDGELYVVVHDFDMLMINHATNAKLNGKNMMNLKDADGKLFNQEIVKALQSAEDGWVSYKWSNPATKKIAQKHAYIHKVGNDLIFIVGYYE